MPSLHKSRKILKSALHTFHKKGTRLTETERNACEEKLHHLDQLIIDKKRDEAWVAAKAIRQEWKERFPKNLFDHAREIVLALVIAIAFAFVIRQTWFELYEVPTGSMRPTIEELDRLVVSKTTFGLKIPFVDRLLLSKEEYLQRNGIATFTVKGMDLPDPKMLYFFLFPGYKQLVKRCVAKPGDQIYFYGGRVYGIDREGNPLTELYDETILQEIGIENIEHIPYITMDGKAKLSNPIRPRLYADATLLQMNKPVARLSTSPSGVISGEFFDGQTWRSDQPALLRSKHTSPVSYSDLWGIGNYGMCRLLTDKQVQSLTGLRPSQKAPLYLEIRHTPNLTYPEPQLRFDEKGQAHPMITPYTSVLPLSEKALETLQSGLFTSRFVVRSGHAYRYTETKKRPQTKQFDPLFPGVPDGTYEFINGQGYKIHIAGIQTKLPEDHPLYDQKFLQPLFNIGIAFNTLFAPHDANQPFNPQRFAYYRSGDLHVMGTKLLDSQDPDLVTFVNKELEQQKRSTLVKPYVAFVDKGAPLLDNGEIDAAFIKSFGLTLPEGHYLGLGDNYTNSADSRDFGFIPMQNLRGSPSFTFWPPGHRLGSLAQPTKPWFTLPNLLVWGTVLILLILYILYAKRRAARGLMRSKKP